MVTESEQDDLGSKENTGKRNQKVWSWSTIWNGANYKKQKNTAVGREKSCNKKKYGKNRTLIDSHILIARLQNLSHTSLRTWKKLNQRKQT